VNYIIVTGASRGLGAALVAAGLDAGAAVIGVSRSGNEELLGPAAVAAAAGSLTWITADLSDPAAAGSGYADLFARITDVVDVSAATSVTLINNAGTLDPVGLTGTDEFSPKGVLRAVTVNVTALIALTHHFIRRFGPLPGPSGPSALPGPPGLPADVRRTVINISSGASGRVMPGLAVYSASKAAVNAFTTSSAAEVDILVSRGGFAPVQMYAVSPGIVDTDMQKTLRSGTPEKLPERDVYASWHTDGKLKTPAETARQILKLVNRTDLVSGQYIHTDEIDKV
jgi:NAD(P)-dependent dehydrogenase (short-subunit alcohol dehydrogenase family)